MAEVKLIRSVVRNFRTLFGVGFRDVGSTLRSPSARMWKLG